MSNGWHDFVVTVDDHGRTTLARAALAAVQSLARPPGPRSNLSPAALHDLIWSQEICPETGRDLNEVLHDLGETVWIHGVVPSDPACVAHLHPPTLVPAVATELAIAASNQSMDSWDQSPSGTEVELHLMDWLCALLGLPDSGSGIMTSGGTASNVLAMTLARSWAADRLGVDVLKTGLPDQARTWRLVCSDQAHFSVQRAAAQLGLGRDAVVVVRSEPTGVMSLEALDETLATLATRDLEPIALIATAGTTDLGVIDPIEEMATRARDCHAWFHVDAAVAGAFLLSDTLRPLLHGIADADSVTIDFHKLWWQPFNASALVVRDADHFDLLRVRSSYLDRGDEIDGVINLVGRSLDTSRRFDAVKVVATLRTIGRHAMASMLEHLVDLARYAGARIEQDARLELVAPPASVMCVFGVRGADADALRRIQQQLLTRGEMVLGRTVINGRAALKFTFMNPLATYDDVDRLIEMVTREISDH
ncbi:MAG: pyridoxal-dependent decarboxylase [Acidimicrobiales bacterium]